MHKDLHFKKCNPGYNYLHICELIFELFQTNVQLIFFIFEHAYLTKEVVQQLHANRADLFSYISMIV